MMYDFGFALGVLLALLGLTASCYIAYQWVYWIENGSFWSLKSHGYKDWWVDEYRRSRLSLFILIFLLSALSGLLGFLA